MSSDLPVSTRKMFAGACTGRAGRFSLAGGTSAAATLPEACATCWPPPIFCGVPTGAAVGAECVLAAICLGAGAASVSSCPAKAAPLAAATNTRAATGATSPERRDPPVLSPIMFFTSTFFLLLILLIMAGPLRTTGPRGSHRG
jgi:hypothetical protein